MNPGRYLHIAHFYALRTALLASNNSEAAVKTLITKLCIASLRYCDLVAADRCFVEAGLACKVRAVDNQSANQSN